MDLPLEYRVISAPYAHAGIVVNGSEAGLLIYSIKDMPIHTRLDIMVLFPKRYELANFKVVAEVIRKDLHLEEDWEGYEYGLKFIEIQEEDRQKLKELLSGQFQVEEISETP